MAALPTRGDTIAAAATPPGRGGIGIVRLSGPQARPIAERITQRHLRTPRELTLTYLHDRDAGRIDQGLAAWFPAPASFTGEDVVELHAHGGPAVMAMLLDACMTAGARPAGPGEFTLRAFLNGKLDLLQAEATADLIAADSTRAARAAMRSLDGAFSRRVFGIRDAVVALRVQLEAAIDFGDEDIETERTAAIAARAADIGASLSALCADAAQGVRVSHGIRVVLVGAPNVGKSTLLNQLAGREVAIVTPIAGTTRDIVREQLTLEQAAVELLDTAGLRDELTVDVVEREGIRRARASLPAADLVLAVVDAALPALARVPAAVVAELGLDDVRDRVVVIVNRIDVTGEAPGWHDGTLRLSGLTGAGLDVLRSHIAGLAAGSVEGGAFAARQRHVAGLEAAQSALATGVAAHLGGAGLELLAEDLRVVQRHLGELVGDVSADDLLGAIFATFCIGK
jgi:tRNA modification GTPase